METILLGAVLCALLVLIVLLVQLQKSLGAQEEIRAQQAREEADRLRNSLDQKVTLSMSVVSDRLAMVNRGLGSMQSLAQGVGDLKKVLTNVKNRGIWGEMQLGNLLGDMLAPEQYGTNVAIRPRSRNGWNSPSVFRDVPGMPRYGCPSMPNSPWRTTSAWSRPGKTGMPMGKHWP